MVFRKSAAFHSLKISDLLMMSVIISKVSRIYEAICI